MSWDIEHAILPIAAILSVSIGWLCARRRDSVLESRPTPLSNMRTLPRAEFFVFKVMPDVHASANDSVRLFESEDALVSDDRMSRRFTWILLGRDSFRRYFATARAALSITPATSLGCDTKTQ
jgi:hypothetical protein